MEKTKHHYLLGQVKKYFFLKKAGGTLFIIYIILYRSQSVTPLKIETPCYIVKLLLCSKFRLYSISHGGIHSEIGGEHN